MPQFLLSVWHDEDYVVDFSSEDAQRVMGQVGALNEELMSSGAWVFGGGLMPASSAATARPGGAPGEATLTDGPYAETKEQLLGLYVLDCASLEEALQIARDLGEANPGGAYEIRPISFYAPGKDIA